MSKKMLNEVAVVVIGRNEGQRLLSCFASFLEKAKKSSMLILVRLMVQSRPHGT